MNAKQFIAKLSEEKGVDVTVAAVRHHARLGRIGYRADGRWVFDTEDIERMMEFAGKQGPKKGLVIRKLEWEGREADGFFSCDVIECLFRVVCQDNGEWHWHISMNMSVAIFGKSSNSQQAKADCESAWHDLLMCDVLEVGK